MSCPRGTTGTRTRSTSWTQALAIPSGIALALHNACRQVIAEGGDQRTDPAVRLICTQLSWLVKGNWDAEDYGALMDACRSKAGDRADAGTA